MATGIEKEAVHSAYEDVRADTSETNWFTLSFNGNSIQLDRSGSDFDEFKSQFTDDERKFGYVRVMTGDEMSKRAKFVFITWAGKDVSPIKKAKLSVDKAIVKGVIKSFAIEVMAEDQSEIEFHVLSEKLIKAGGANYGTGKPK